MYAYLVLTLEAISKIPFVLEIPIAIMPKKGKAIAVSKKPKSALKIFEPADWPKCIGNIRLPAPKNKPNNNDPINIFSLKLSLCFMMIYAVS